jgi:hypothetical protein
MIPVHDHIHGWWFPIHGDDHIQFTLFFIYLIKHHLFKEDKNLIT